MSADGVIRAALLLIALGEEEAAEAFRHLSPRAVLRGIALRLSLVLVVACGVLVRLTGILPGETACRQGSEAARATDR
ncbi:hypothetical protein [Paraburkholderia hospita]|uniref:hypothetical protein n=1 Tax=Paraburkholderia hospita TaxID=169430 RepID=UPI001F39A435|nr:hypothetical protein [Paraburkholderia hospita]